MLLKTVFLPAVLLFALFFGLSSPIHAQESMTISGEWKSPYTTEVHMRADGLEGKVQWHVRYSNAQSCQTGKPIKGETDLIHRSQPPLPENENKFNEMNCGEIEYSAKDIHGKRVAKTIHINSGVQASTMTGGTIGTANSQSASTSSSCRFFGEGARGSNVVEVLVSCLNIRKDPDASKDNIVEKAAQGSTLSWVSTILTGSGFPWYEVQLPNGGTGFMAGETYSHVKTK